MSKKIQTEEKFIEIQEMDNGYTFQIYINGIFVPLKNIDRILIRESIFTSIPRLEFSFRDDGLFIELNPIMEGQIVKIIFSKNGEDKNILNQEFRIISSKVSMMGGSEKVLYNISIDGWLNIPGFLNGINYRSFKNTNFSDVIIEIGDSLKIPTKIEVKSNDNMTWLAMDTWNDFINKSIYKSRVSIDDTPFCYINRNGELVYNSFKNAVSVSSDIRFIRDHVKKHNTVDDENNYFSNFSFNDISGFTNIFNGGFGGKISFFDGEYEKEKMVIDLNHSKLVDYKNKNSELKKFSSKYNFGTINNVYDDYFETVIRNRMMRQSLLSTSIVISVQAKYFSLMEKINITLNSNMNRDEIIGTYSGDYIIGGIINSFENNTFNQILICYRDGYNINKMTKIFTSPLIKV